MKYGKLEFIKDIGNKFGLFKCDCGNTKELYKYNVFSLKTTSCGCNRKINIDSIIDNKFGNLKILDYKHINNMIYVNCICDCGKTKNNIYLGALKGGTVISCGCARRGHKANFKHGMSEGGNNGRHRLYRIWVGIQGRCNRVNDSNYKYYGLRGIKCEWINFIGFKDDMYESYLEHIEKYGEKETTIERIDNNGNYCKENCRWATIVEQANNRSNNVDHNMLLKLKYEKKRIKLLKRINRYLNNNLIRNYTLKRTIIEEQKITVDNYNNIFLDNFVIKKV